MGARMGKSEESERRHRRLVERLGERGMTYEQHRQLLALAWCAAVLATLFVFLVYLALR